jgi:hypothetical protein
MEAEEQLFGPINIEGYGIILVPGINNEIRTAYAAGLSIREGIFIPNKPCISVITFDDIEEGTPFTAIGTLDSYGCYTIEDLMMVPDDYRQIIANLPELIAFARYYGNVELEQRFLRIQLGSNYVNELQSIILSLDPEQIQKVVNALDVLKRSFYPGCNFTPDGYNNALEALQTLRSIIPTVKGIQRLGTTYKASNVPYVELVEETLNGNYCLVYLSETTNELSNVILALFTPAGLQQAGLTLTPSRGQEILEIGPAIALQPGGANIGTYQQQSLWAGSMSTAQNINPNYRRVYEICGGVIDNDSLMILAQELDIPVPQGYTSEDLCRYLKNYIERYTSP